jgi:predicted metal-dependent hydrolase
VSVNWYSDISQEAMHEQAHMHLNESLTDMNNQMMAMHGELDMLAQQMARDEISTYAQEDLLMAWEAFYHQQAI